MIKPAFLTCACAFVLLAAGPLGCAEEAPDTEVPNGEEESSSSALSDAGAKQDARAKKDAGANRDAADEDEADDESEADDDASDESSSSGDEDEGDDEGADDHDADEPADEGDADVSADEGDADVPVDDDATGGSDAGAEDDSAGEWVTTASGTKIYLDPSCESLTPMMPGTMAGMPLELVGCCTEGGMCGLSNHKVMFPEGFASMFPVQCDGYDMLAGFGIETPEPKTCTIPD